MQAEGEVVWDSKRFSPAIALCAYARKRGAGGADGSPSAPDTQSVMMAAASGERNAAAARVMAVSERVILAKGQRGWERAECDDERAGWWTGGKKKSVKRNSDRGEMHLCCAALCCEGRRERGAEKREGGERREGEGK